MSQYITLLGAEEVSRAAYTMSSAGSEMQRAASSMESVFTFHVQRLIDDSLMRLDAILEKRNAELREILGKPSESA